MVARHALNVKLWVRILTPQPFWTDLLICFDAKGGGEVKKKQRCFLKRFAALVASLMLCASLCVPCFASNNWPFSPVANDFLTHPNSWYVWQHKSISGFSGFELICQPMFEQGSSNTPDNSFPSYSTNSSTYSYTNVSGVTRTLMYCFPYIPCSAQAGYWSDLPSFPVGQPSAYCACVRIYPYTSYGSLSGISNVFSDRSIYGFLTSWRSSGSSSIADYYDNEILDYLPLYVPSNAFFFGERTSSSSSSSGFGICNGDNNFWATPSNENFLGLRFSHFGFFKSFPTSFSIPSSELGLVFCKRPSGSSAQYSNSVFDASLKFAASLWVPASLLPSDVRVGDWITKADVESLQDQLIKDFGVNSDTLKKSEDTLNSWGSTSSVDTDVASTSISALNAMFQNLGGFLFVISLMVFGAVVLRMFIRKAVDG